MVQAQQHKFNINVHHSVQKSNGMASIKATMFVQQQTAISKHNHYNSYEFSGNSLGFQNNSRAYVHCVITNLKTTFKHQQASSMATNNILHDINNKTTSRNISGQGFLNCSKHSSSSCIRPRTKNSRNSNQAYKQHHQTTLNTNMTPIFSKSSWTNQTDRKHICTQR